MNELAQNGWATSAVKGMKKPIETIHFRTAVKFSNPGIENELSFPFILSDVMVPVVDASTHPGEKTFETAEGQMDKEASWLFPVPVTQQVLSTASLHTGQTEEDVSKTRRSLNEAHGVKPVALNSIYTGGSDASTPHSIHLRDDNTSIPGECRYPQPSLDLLQKDERVSSFTTMYEENAVAGDSRNLSLDTRTMLAMGDEKDVSFIDTTTFRDVTSVVQKNDIGVKISEQKKAFQSECRLKTGEPDSPRSILSPSQNQEKTYAPKIMNDGDTTDIGISSPSPEQRTVVVTAEKNATSSIKTSPVLDVAGAEKNDEEASMSSRQPAFSQEKFLKGETHKFRSESPERNQKRYEILLGMIEAKKKEEEGKIDSSTAFTETTPSTVVPRTGEHMNIAIETKTLSSTPQHSGNRMAIPASTVLSIATRTTGNPTCVSHAITSATDLFPSVRLGEEVSRDNGVIPTIPSHTNATEETTRTHQSPGQRISQEDWFVKTFTATGITSIPPVTNTEGHRAYRQPIVDSDVVLPPQVALSHEHAPEETTLHSLATSGEENFWRDGFVTASAKERNGNIIPTPTTGEQNWHHQTDLDKQVPFKTMSYHESTPRETAPQFSATPDEKTLPQGGFAPASSVTGNALTPHTPSVEEPVRYHESNIDGNIAADCEAVISGGKSHYVHEQIAVRRDDTNPPGRAGESVLHPHSVITQIMDGVSLNIKKGGRVRISLEPETLGHLDVDLLIRNERISLILRVDNPDVRLALTSRIDDLKANLHNQGFQVINIDVTSEKSHGGQDGGFYHDNLSGHTHSGSNYRDTATDDRKLNGELLTREWEPHEEAEVIMDRIHTRGISLFI